jgi:integrase/recombinase XerD
MGKPSRVRVTGPLAPHAGGFRRELGRLGYRPNAASNQLQLMAHLSRWLDASDLAVEEVSPATTEAFLAHRRDEGYTLWLSPKALEPLLGFLRCQGAVPAPEATPEPVSVSEQVLADYQAYLVSERGLAEGTIAGYLHVAELFVRARQATAGEALAMEKLTAGEVTEFVLAECSSRSVGSAKSVVCGLRSLLRYLHVTERVEMELAAAVPSVSGWKQTGVPVSFGPDEVERLLASCDRRSRVGRRDFAVLCLLARLGMRSGEVAALLLGDIDWRGGEIIVRGKGPRVERLPLPADVGDAIAGWVQRGRPRCESSAVITRVRAPHGPLSSGGVSGIVASACRRAGLPVAHAHRLRHAAATQMLRAGGSLTEVGQVLRHVSVLTTAIYAKVDYDRLAALAQPWPQVVAS